MAGAKWWHSSTKDKEGKITIMNSRDKAAIRKVRLMQTFGLGELITMLLEEKWKFSLDLNKQKSSKSSEQKSLNSEKQRVTAIQSIPRVKPVYRPQTP